MQGIAFESVDVRSPAGRPRWEAAGSPTVPSVLVGGELTPILHVSQLARALGLEVAPAAGTGGLARDCSALLAAWLEELEPLSWETLLAPTPSRGRTLRELTVNVFHPFELLPTAWAEGCFEWYPEGDAERESAFAGAAELAAWAGGVLAAWSVFVAAAADELDAFDPEIGTPRGPLRYGELVDTHRTHAAFHFRQLAAFLELEGRRRWSRLALADLPGLVLPAAVF